MKTHGSTQPHKDKETSLSGKTSQRVLVSKDNGISLSEKSLTLSFADQFLNAETLQVLDTVSSNHSFASTNGNNDKLRIMFPDSQIARSFHQTETKTKYMRQFEVALYVQKQVISLVNLLRLSLMKPPLRRSKINMTVMFHFGHYQRT